MRAITAAATLFTFVRLFTLAINFIRPGPFRGRSRALRCTLQPLYLGKDARFGYDDRLGCCPGGRLDASSDQLEEDSHVPRPSKLGY
jgi:hypothetical protein